MAIRIYNTLTQRKEDFVPVTPGKVGIYSCGPTVYDYFHIGNARALSFPMLFGGISMQRIRCNAGQNITDIEDKIERAAQRGIAPPDIVDEFTEAYRGQEALGVRAPDIQPRATEHVDEMIQMIQALVTTVWRTRDGDVCHDVSKFEHYGILSNQED